MKTTLQFTEEEQQEAKRAIHASDLYACLWNTKEQLTYLIEYRGELAFSDQQLIALREIIAGPKEVLDFIEPA